MSKDAKISVPKKEVSGKDFIKKLIEKQIKGRAKNN